MAGLTLSNEAFDVPCSWDAYACICQRPPVGYAGNLTSSSIDSFLVELREADDKAVSEAVVGQWVDFYVRTVVVLIALSVAATFWCCVLSRSCCWARHVAERGPAAGSAEAKEPRTCCGATSDHTKAREADPSGRAASKVRTEAFDCLRGFAALQVSLGHYFTYWAPNVFRGELGGGDAVLMFFLMSGFVMQVGYAGKGPADGSCPCCGDCCPSEGCCACCSRGRCCLGCGGTFARQFWARRLARLAPMAWVAMLVYAPIAYFENLPRVGQLPEAAQALFLTEDLAVSAVFLPTWVACGVNGPLWTLTAQWFFCAPRTRPARETDLTTRPRGCHRGRGRSCCRCARR